MFALVTIFAISIAVNSSSITMQSVRHVDTVQKRKEEKLYANNLLQLGASWYVNESPSFSSCNATAISLLAQFMKDVQDDLIDGTLWLNVAQDASESGQCVNLTDHAIALIEHTATDVLPKGGELQVYAFKLTEDYGGRVLVIAKVGETFSWALGVASGGSIFSTPFFTALFHSEAGKTFIGSLKTNLNGSVEVNDDFEIIGVHEMNLENVVKVDGDLIVDFVSKLAFHDDVYVKGDLLVSNYSWDVKFDGDVYVEGQLRITDCYNVHFNGTVHLSQDPIVQNTTNYGFANVIIDHPEVEPVPEILSEFPARTYIDSVRANTVEIESLLSSPPSQPVGILIPQDAQLYFEYDEPVQKMVIKTDSKTYEVSYSASGADNLHQATITRGALENSFTFTGVVLAKSLRISRPWYLFSSDPMKLAYSTTLIASETIEFGRDDLVYEFLPPDVDEWVSSAENTESKTLLTVVALDDISFEPSLSQKITASLISLSGAVRIPLSFGLAIFGNILERSSRDLETLLYSEIIFDPRLAEGNVTYVEHPGEYIDSGSTGGIDLR